MNAVMEKSSLAVVAPRELAKLRDQLLAQKARLDSLLAEAERILKGGTTPAAATTSGRQKKPAKGMAALTHDLRVANGNLSADLVARVFGVSVSQLAGWLGRTRQSVTKTPDADSLQAELAVLERVARLRSLTGNDAEFRKWLRTPQDELGKLTPLDRLAEGKRQAIADFVEDIVTGNPG